MEAYQRPDTFADWIPYFNLDTQPLAKNYCGSPQNLDINTHETGAMNNQHIEDPSRKPW